MLLKASFYGRLINTTWYYSSHWERIDDYSDYLTEHGARKALRDAYTVLDETEEKRDKVMRAIEELERAGIEPLGALE